MLGRSLGNPYDNKRSCITVCGRDQHLLDISDTALDGLTRLLRLSADEGVHPNNPPQPWIIDQEAQIAKLSRRLQMPQNIFSRAAIAAGKHNIKFFPEAAILCEVHKGLDPRVIRNLMLLVGVEATARTDKYRHASRDGEEKRLQLPKAVEDWIVGMDAIATVWVGNSATFKCVYRYKPQCRDMFPCVSCEACKLCVIGGNPDMLADLRTGIRARKTAQRRQRPRARGPRLARIISSWHKQYKVDGKRHVVDYIRSKSEDAQSAMVEAGNLIVEEKRKAWEQKRKQGKHSSKKHRSPSSSSSHHRHRHRHQRSGRTKGSSSPSRPNTSSGHSHRGREKADIAASLPTRPQSMRRSGSRTPSTPARGSTASMTQTSHMTEWPSPLSFGQDRDEPEHEFFPSPLSDRPPSSRKYAFVDEDADDHDDDQDSEVDRFYEDTEDLDEAEEASAWFCRHTKAMTDTERTLLAQALPAFTTFQAMSAVPEPLETHHMDNSSSNILDGKEDADVHDTESWISASVATYMPGQAPPAAAPTEIYTPPRPPSSIYTTTPMKHRSRLVSAGVRSETMAWNQWQKRFVNEYALASLEGRRGPDAS